MEKPALSSTISPLSSATAQRTLPVTALIPAPYQPRKKFDEAELAALSESIRAHGILQPLLVRPSKTQSGKYEIIAGERRWRASQLVQLHDVPVVVQELDDRATLEIALIENIQRADLTAIEEAEGYQRLIAEFGHTQEALAKIVGRSRSHLTNIMRLLALPDSVREKINRGVLSPTHARHLVGMENAEALAGDIIRKNLSVRQTERLIAHLKNPRKPGAKLPSLRDLHFMAMQGGKAKDPEVAALEREMGNLLGLKTEIQPHAQGSGGTLHLHYANLDQLDDLLRKLTRAARG